jgi:hypothetical protein
LELEYTSKDGTTIKSPHLFDSRTFKIRHNKYIKWYESVVTPYALKAEGMDEIILESVNADARKVDRNAYHDYFRSLGYNLFSWDEMSYDRNTKAYELRRIKWDYTHDITKEIAGILCPNSNRFTYEDGYLMLPPDARAVERYNRDVEWNNYATIKRDLNEELLLPTKCKIVINKSYTTDEDGATYPTSSEYMSVYVMVFGTVTLNGETRTACINKYDFTLTIGTERLGSYSLMGLNDHSYELCRIYLEASDYCRAYGKNLKPRTDSTYDSVVCEPSDKS